MSVNHPEDVSYRAFDPAGDYPALVGLIHASNRFDRVDDLPTVENLRTEQSHIEGFDPRDDVLLAEIDGSLRAAARTIARTRDGRGSSSARRRSRPSMAEQDRASSRRGSARLSSRPSRSSRRTATKSAATDS